MSFLRRLFCNPPPPYKIEVYLRADGQWGARMRSTVNGRIVLGPDPYFDRSTAISTNRDIAERLGIEAVVDRIDDGRK